jgi:hypothetical protein
MDTVTNAPSRFTISYLHTYKTKNIAAYEVMGREIGSRQGKDRVPIIHMITIFAATLQIFYICTYLVVLLSRKII